MLTPYPRLSLKMVRDVRGCMWVCGWMNWSLPCAAKPIIIIPPLH